MSQSQEVRNILVSVGVADALGSDIEFMACPNKGHFLHEVNGSHPLRATDDTQMSLFTAEALLKGYKRDEFKNAYLQWYKTQVARVPLVTEYSLTNETVLYSQRAPGNTCMQSLREMTRYKKRMRNDSKGNGTVMRCFPLVPYVSVETLDDMLSDCTYSTHDHVFAFVATKLAVVIGKGMWAGLSLEKLLQLYERHFTMIGMTTPLDKIKRAKDIGGGWIAEEALMIALWAFWHGEGDWLKTIELATVHPGDSDTTAAIAGGFLGCMGVLPPVVLQERLDVLGVINRLIDRYPQEANGTV